MPPNWITLNSKDNTVVSRDPCRRGAVYRWLTAQCPMIRLQICVVNAPPYGDLVLAKITLSRDAWLEQALRVLREEGIQGVRVERLARDLNVSKGSFYWHFQDREDMRRAMLDYWAESYTGAVVDNPEFQRGDPATALRAAMKMVRELQLDEYELTIRAWADHDAMADRVVREVYSRRSEFVSGLFRRLGFRGLDAEIRTRLMLCYMSWEPNMYADETKQRRLRLLALQHEILTRK